MNLFRTFLVAIFIAIATYTGVVAVHHGVDLFTVFFGDLAKLSWSGQFNLDFTCLLALSGIWVAYRHPDSCSRSRSVTAASAITGVPSAP